ncbi:contractile injection system tape measure protein [Massilia endophytica]|uniref:contractile injection system tape measure protein n=1 Tax=Massilia endophytica TaxID=2899220 RepID=UPI001E5F9292|nr:contractile injection system tape measure protein [Massilia endophytica]UGQ48180.1 hypothetical protein LSQ66_06865 [Massilia endophytica]
MSDTLLHIGQLRFELDVETLPRARSVTERVSAFGRQRLPALLAELMADAAGAGHVLSIDSIVLDLGALSEAELERQLGDALERALRAWLQQQVGLAPRGRPQLARPASEADPAWRDMLQLFGGAVMRHADAVLERAFARWPLEALGRLRAEGRKQAVRRHLAYSLPPPAMERLLRALEPSESPLIVAYVADVCEMHRHRPLVPESRQGFRAVMWEFVLSYLLLERGSYFNTRSMVGHTLLQIARRYRVDYGWLLDQLTECLAVRELPLADRTGLRGILLDLRQQQADAADTQATGVPVARRRLDCIAGFLERGVWTGSLAKASAMEGFAAMMDAACEEDPDALLPILRRAGTRPAALRRLASQLPESGRERLVHLLEPVHGGWIVATVRGIGQVQAERHVVQDDYQRFGRRLWEFVFSALLVERGSVFNTRAFVRSLVVQLAAHYNMAYRQLLHALIGVAAGLQAPQARAQGLPAILLWLQKESADALPPVRPEPEPPQRLQMQRAMRGAVLRHVLGGGKAPAGLRGLLAEALREGARVSGGSLPQWLAAAIGQQPDLERLLLQRDDMAAILNALGEELAAGDMAPAGGIARPVPAPLRQPARFARAAREFVLRSFRIERGSYFNNRSYIKQLLHQLSARHGMDYADLLRGLISQAAIASNPEQTTLPGILLALKAETGTGLPVAERGRAEAPQAPSRSSAEEDPLWLFLRHGRLSGARSEALLREGLSSIDSTVLARALRAAPNPVAMLERLIRHLPAERLNALVEALATGGAGLAETWRLAVLALHGSLPTAGMPRAVLDAHAWRAIFRVLLRRERGEFSASAFLSSAAHALAGKLGLTGSALVSRLMAVAAARMGGAPRYRVLLELLAQAGGRIALSPAGGTLAATQPRAPQENGASPQYRAEDASEAPPAAEALEAWLRYGGTPPGHLGAPQLLFQLLLDEQPLAARALVLSAARRQLDRWRLASLMSGKVRDGVLRLLLGANASEFEWWISALASAAASPAVEQGAVRALLEAVARLSGRAPSLAAWLPAAVAEAAAPQERETALEALRRQVRQLAPERRAEASRGLELAAAKLQQAARVPAESSPWQFPAAAEEELPEGELFAVDNAGIVLLWPFLDRYFDMLGMVKDGAFIGEREQHRAVELLRYLSHGELHAPEDALLLNKVLCGLDPVAPMDAGGPLTELERDMSLRILGAVTQHWDKLANTDAEGLQATFLRREGSLMRKEENWNLAVPRQTFDVLMASLPWALGTIRLSWMRGVLTVDWS